MEKLHFADLSKINSPLGLLDDDTRKRLMQSTEEIEFLSLNMGIWCHTDEPSWMPGTTYRVKPKPVITSVWVNCYRTGEFGSICKSRDIADNSTSYGVKRSCVFRIEFEKGGHNPKICREEV